MAQQESKEIVRRSYQVISEGVRSGDFSGLDEVVARDVRDHNPDPGQEQGLEGVRGLFMGLRDAFPDLQIHVEDLIAEGDKVVGRATFRGTHSGDFQGIPATGKQIEVQVIDILRIQDGKIVERWGLSDQLGLMQQLGAMPA
ncbi:MAG TPA: ester cyclase [Longimicrobiaceae bacterium]|nr:ester cyclase [Longimicrobiaceae bacterium]